MVCSAWRIFTWHPRARGFAVQVVSGQPPAHGTVQQKIGVIRLAPGVGHPDHQVGALCIQRMPKVLIKIALQRLVHGQGVLALCGQRLKGLPQQIGAKALGKGTVGLAQGLGYRPRPSGCVGFHRIVSMRVAMAKLCGETAFQCEFILESRQEGGVQ